jgi:leucyl aminopeptidase
MDISIEFKKKPEINSDTLVVGVYSDKRLSPSAEKIDKELNGLINSHIKAHNIFKGKHGQILSIPTSEINGLFRVILIGLGDSKKLNHTLSENLGGKIYSALKNNGVREATIFIDDDQNRENIPSDKMAAHIALGIRLRSYKFHQYKSKPEENLPEIERIEMITSNHNGAKDLFFSLDAEAHGVFLARDLMNEPPNILYPEHYAELLKEDLSPLGIEVEVIDMKKMQKLGFTSHLAVGQGSIRPPCVVVMHWKGSSEEQDQPLGFVGKGITFDTGGISIKPSASMEEMKMDMGGSAAVCGLMKTLALRKAKINVIGIVALAENMPSHNAYRPGDIITSMSGKTIEVINTDAEGRLVLIDSLTYIQKNYNPKLVIDLATLTGAIMVALGFEYGGAFVNNEKLWSELENASKLSGEKLWRMPLDDAYRKEMEGNLSDLQNLGSVGRWGGACTAAGFIEHFIENDLPWAHLDIAGMMNWKKDKPTSPKGPPGYGVRLLNTLIALHYESSANNND